MAASRRGREQQAFEYGQVIPGGLVQTQFMHFFPSQVWTPIHLLCGVVFVKARAEEEWRCVCCWGDSWGSLRGAGEAVP